jgi:hypothetical protein
MASNEVARIERRCGDEMMDLRTQWMRILVPQIERQLAEPADAIAEQDGPAQLAPIRGRAEALTYLGVAPRAGHATYLPPSTPALGQTPEHGLSVAGT